MAKKVIIKRNLEIGTEDPSEKLHVAGNTGIEGDLKIKGKIYLNLEENKGAIHWSKHDLTMGTSPRTHFHNNLHLKPGGSDSGTLWSILHMYTAESSSKHTKKVQIHTYGATFFNGGNVGIGTDSPENKLTVNSDNYGIIQKHGTVEVGTYINTNLGAIGTKSDHKLQFMVNGSYKAIIGKNGNMRIGDGTNEPTRAKLVVMGTGNNNSKVSKYGYLQYHDMVEKITRDSRNLFSIYSQHRIACSSVRTFSDKRIKNIKNVSNSKNDLKILSKIEITDYQHIDLIGKGNGTNKKVIAQQVKTVFPQAVSEDFEDYIPNIYTKTKIEKGWIQLETDLKIDDLIKLHFSEETLEARVLEVKSNSFKVDTDKEGDVFVYGKQVNDFHMVDYDAISMLNVSATQELLKRVSELENENQQFRKDLATIQQEVRVLLTEKS